MFKQMYNDIVYSYTLYICKEYSQVKKFATIYIVGLKTVSHIFKFLLLNNIDHTIIQTYCIKSYYYYCEFILQIQNNNIYSLNYTDASLFVFKKFISSSLSKHTTPCSDAILHDILYYSETVIFLIDSYIDFNKIDSQAVKNLDPVIKLLGTLTNYDEVTQCIILIKSRSNNGSVFLKLITKVLLFTQKHGPIKYTFKLSTYPLSNFMYLLE